jgi:hypothetical protein
MVHEHRHAVLLQLPAEVREHLDGAVDLGERSLEVVFGGPAVDDPVVRDDAERLVGRQLRAQGLERLGVRRNLAEALEQALPSGQRFVLELADGAVQRRAGDAVDRPAKIGRAGRLLDHLERGLHQRDLVPEIVAVLANGSRQGLHICCGHVPLPDSPSAEALRRPGEDHADSHAAALFRREQGERKIRVGCRGQRRAGAGRRRSSVSQENAPLAHIR